MYRKDYMVRQLEEFGKVLAAIISFRKNRDRFSAEKEIQQAVSRFTGLELEFVKSLSLEEMNHYLSHSVSLNQDQLKILADLLFEDYFIHSSDVSAEIEVACLNKILALYEMHQNQLTQNEFNLEVHYKIGTVRKLLKLNPPSQL